MTKESAFVPELESEGIKCYRFDINLSENGFNEEEFEAALAEICESYPKEPAEMKFLVRGDSMYVFANKRIDPSHFEVNSSLSGEAEDLLCAGFLTVATYGDRKMRIVAGSSISLNNYGILRVEDSVRFKDSTLNEILNPYFSVRKGEY